MQTELRVLGLGESTDTSTIHAKVASAALARAAMSFQLSGRQTSLAETALV